MNPFEVIIHFFGWASFLVLVISILCVIGLPIALLLHSIFINLQAFILKLAGQKDEN